MLIVAAWISSSCGPKHTRQSRPLWARGPFVLESPSPPGLWTSTESSACIAAPAGGGTAASADDVRIAAARTYEQGTDGEHRRYKLWLSLDASQRRWGNTASGRIAPSGSPTRARPWTQKYG